MELERELSDKLKRIFKVKKVSFDEPGEAAEQECLFINIERSINSARDGIFKARVEGSCVVFGTNQKLPVGYFNRCLQESPTADTKDLFCFDFETNTKRFKDKVQRGFSFVYFFSTQYDPEQGTLDEVDFNTEES